MSSPFVHFMNLRSIRSRDGQCPSGGCSLERAGRIRRRRDIRESNSDAMRRGLGETSLRGYKLSQQDPDSCFASAGRYVCESSGARACVDRRKPSGNGNCAAERVSISIFNGEYRESKLGLSVGSQYFSALSGQIRARLSTTYFFTRRVRRNTLP